MLAINVVANLIAAVTLVDTPKDPWWLGILVTAWRSFHAVVLVVTTLVVRTSMAAWWCA